MLDASASVQRRLQVESCRLKVLSDHEGAPLRFFSPALPHPNVNVRLKGNAVRLRVMQSDLDRFRAGGRVESTTRFGPGAALTCALTVDAEAEAPTVRFDGRRLTVRVPEALARDWTTTDRVGFEARQPTGGGAALHLSVEKDLGCRHQDDPDAADKFAHLAEEESSDA